MTHVGQEHRLRRRSNLGRLLGAGELPLFDFASRQVDHGDDHHRPFPRCHGPETELDLHLFRRGVEHHRVAAQAVWPCRCPREVIALRRLVSAGPTGHNHLDVLASERIELVAEHFAGLRVGNADAVLCVDQQQRHRCGGEEHIERNLEHLEVAHMLPLPRELCLHALPCAHIAYNKDLHRT